MIAFDPQAHVQFSHFVLPLRCVRVGGEVALVRSADDGQVGRRQPLLQVYRERLDGFVERLRVAVALLQLDAVARRLREAGDGHGEHAEREANRKREAFEAVPLTSRQKMIVIVESLKSKTYCDCADQT